MRQAGVLVAVALLLVLADPAAHAELQRRRLDDVPCCPSLDANVWWRIGPSDGFLQTPRGGRPGTTSPRRPTLDELGIGATGEVGLDLTTSWRRHEFAFHGACLLLGGSDRLGRDLVSQGSSFPAGTEIDSSSYLATFRFGYRYRLHVPLGRERLVLKPEVGLTSLLVDEELEGVAGAQVDRSYSHLGPHAGLVLAWRPHGTSRFALTGGVTQTLGFLLPESNRMDILDASLRATWDLARRWRLLLEVGWKRIDWQDDQTVPNHVHVEFGPYVGLGAGVTF